MLLRKRLDEGRKKGAGLAQKIRQKPATLRHQEQMRCNSKEVWLTTSRGSPWLLLTQENLD
jgi:hypothetical protein